MSHWRGAVTQFVLLLAFWIALSGELRPLFLLMGAASSALVTALTYRTVGTVLDEPTHTVASWLVRAWWFVVFLGWLLTRIVVASSQVAYYALHPGIPFVPRFVRFRTDLQRPLSRVVLATSITLVPGTITVRLDEQEYLVHTLIPGSADDLASARMQNMVARFLGEERQEPPEMVWGPIIEDAVR